MKITNKTDIPDNVIIKRNKVAQQSKEIEQMLPFFLDEYTLYLKNAVAPSTRLSYLNDIKHFLEYLISENEKFVSFQTIKEITIEEFKEIKARDVNHYIGDYCAMYEKDGTIVTNGNRSLAKKKSALSVMFKYLFVNETIPNNISEGFNPIKLPKVQPDAIKKLEIEEITKLIKIVSTGEGLSKKEKQFWEKTKLRDKAIIVMFITYGLRVSELQQLDIESINYERMEFTIYRKRGKESKMPLNQSVSSVLKDYIENERGNSSEDDNPLFLSLQNKRLTVRAIRDLIKKYTAIVLGNNGYSPHKLRATAASTMIEYGFSIYDVQNILDHENVTTTQLYSAHKKNAKSDLIHKFELLKDNDE